MSYTITFHPEADGGPMHVLSLLSDYAFEFRKNGRTVVEGLASVDDTTTDVVFVRLYNGSTGCFDIGPVLLRVGVDFDEIQYM